MKRIVSAIIAAAMALSINVFSINAAENDVTISFDQSVYSVDKDQEFDVAVNVTENPIGFNNATFFLRYDPNVIQAVACDEYSDDLLMYEHSSGLYSTPFFTTDFINAQISTKPSKESDDYDNKGDGKKTAAEIGIIKLAGLISDYETIDGQRYLKNIEGTGTLFKIRFKAVADGTTNITIDESATGSFVGSIQKFSISGCSSQVIVGNGSINEVTTSLQGGSSSSDETETTTSSTSGGGSEGKAETTTDTATEVTSAETMEHSTETTTSSAEITFNDIADYPWAAESIRSLASMGVINGYSDGSFRPNNNIKRADFMLMLMKTIGIDTTIAATDNFTDVNASSYYAGAVGTAKMLGIASGNGDGTFSPESEITRQDMMILAKKAIEYKKHESIEGDLSVLDRFSDSADISAYARESLAAMVQAGIVNGMGEGIAPKNNTTRAQAAVIMSKIIDELK